MKEWKFKEETKVIKVLDQEIISCDLCGFKAETEEESWDIFTLRIESGMDTCGHERITRDVCRECYESKVQPGWDMITEVLRRVETDELREYHEDR